MSSSKNTSTAGSSAATTAADEDDTAPLWKYVTVLEKAVKGGNKRFQCNICHKTMNGSYSRVKGHLLRIKDTGVAMCSKLTSAHIDEIERVVEEAERRAQNALPRRVPLPSASNASTIGNFRLEGFESRKRKQSGNCPLEKAFNLQARDQLHEEIARMFYSGGLPFHLARNPYYASSYTFAANNPISGYIPPGYNMLRTTLLQKERANIERLLEPIRQSWKEKGVSIVNDGWTDAQRRPLINFMAVTESGPMFLKAVNCEGVYKDKFFIANIIKDTILEVGPSNVVQVITDNAPVCRAAGLLVETQYPHIFWTPCVVHTLNLALKNICAAKNTEANEVTYDECSWISIVAADAVMIKNFIMNHSMRLAMYNEILNLRMLSIAETRFASVVIMLKRFKDIKRGLQTLVISEQWSCYREDDALRAQRVKEKVLDDLWWDKIDYIVSFTEPIYEMLRVADTDRPTLHLVYDMWDSMIEKVKKVIYRHEKRQDHEESSFYLVVHNILVDRWNKSNTPLHCLAHSLNPRYYSTKWLNEAPNRTSPHKDLEISNERNKCLKRYFASSDDRRVINVEFAKFSSATGEFADRDSQVDRGEMEPKDWWVIYGASSPMLQTLALKILGQPCSSSCCERNWSTYSFINSMRRNKLTPQRAQDLVYVHTNLRLLSRRSPQYMQGASKMWDVGGDAFDSLDGGVGILEIAELSLDEPELEAMIFTDEGGDGDDVVDLEDGST